MERGYPLGVPFLVTELMPSSKSVLPDKQNVEH